MKLRLAAHALRLRILRTELARLEAGEVLRETVRLAPGAEGCIGYALAVAGPEQQHDAHVSCVNGSVQVVLSQAAFRRWCLPDEVGVYARVETGEGEPLQLVVEKDFACLDRDEAGNRDTFEHPEAGAVC